MSTPLWPHRDFALNLTGAILEVGTTILLNGTAMLRVIERIGDGSWRVRPTTSARALDRRYQRRQRNRRRR